LLSRKTQLENELKMAEVIDLSSVDVSMVSIGSVVTARKDGSSESSDFTILGAWDSDPARNIISYKTAMAQALLGKKVGDVVEIESGNTTETWKVESIRAYDS
jgi:transcription elongation GreA/GreB family factor